MTEFSTSDTRATSMPDEENRGFGRSRRGSRWIIGAVVLLAAGLGIVVLLTRSGGNHARPVPPLAAVTVSQPLIRPVSPRTTFLGQFSAVNSVELRAQVGGTLSEIHFTDGQVVHAGDLLFVIDPRPYQIKLVEEKAQLATARAKLALTNAELWRAQQLKQTSFGTAENVDQRRADADAANAVIDQTQAQIADAALDIEFSHVRAPFTGRISRHLASIGSLISGSRGGTSGTTLLTTLVSLDPIYLEFDMSESDYLAFERARMEASRQGQAALPNNTVDISLGDENHFTRSGTLDFIDNVLDRSSGTIHARATVPNPDLFIKPGEFARIRVTVAPPVPTLLVPGAAVLVDQSQHIVMIVAPDGMVVAKPVEVGELRGNLQVVRSGLSPDDHVIIDGLMQAVPGMKVKSETGAIHLDGTDD